MKKVAALLLCVCAAAMLFGCWSRKEPKTLAIVNSIVYDLSDDGDYILTAEIINPAAGGGVKDSGGGAAQNPNITVTAEGVTMAGALRAMSRTLEKRVFGGHNNVRFFTEEFAREGLVPVIDFLLRDRITDETPLAVVVKGDEAGQLYSCKSGLSELVGNYMDTLSRTQPEQTGNSVFVSFLDFIKDYYEGGKQPVMGLARLEECGDKTMSGSQLGPDQKEGGGKGEDENGTGKEKAKEYKIVYEGLAAFKDAKLVGFLDAEQTALYNYLTNNIKTDIISVKLGNGETVVKTVKSKADIKTSFIDGRAVINITVKITANLIQQSASIDISRAEPLKKVEEHLDELMTAQLSNVIRKVQNEFNSDIFGFGKSMHAQNPRQWREIKGTWDDYFSQAEVNVTAKTTVTRTGQMEEPFTIEEVEDES